MKITLLLTMLAIANLGAEEPQMRQGSGYHLVQCGHQFEILFDIIPGTKTLESNEGAKYFSKAVEKVRQELEMAGLIKTPKMVEALNPQSWLEALVVKYLDQHPDDWGQSEHKLLKRALVAIYPTTLPSQQAASR